MYGSRWRRTAAATLVVAASLLVTLGSSAGAGAVWNADVVGARVAVPATGAALPALDARAPLPAPSEVARAVGAGLGSAALGPAVAGSVVDVTSGQVLWSAAAGQGRVPASLTKILTAAAALTTLGPQDVSVTSLLTSGELTGGVLHGDLVLRGSGDVLLTAGRGPAWPARAGIDQLVAGLRAAGVTRVQGRLIGDGSLFAGPGTAASWEPSYVTGGSVAPVTALGVDEAGAAVGRGNRSGDPRRAAVTALRVALASAGIAVTGANTVGVAPGTARVLASVAGTPVRASVEEMLQNSDNDMAESLGRRIAIRLGHPATFAGAATAIEEALGRLGVPVAGLDLDDASGLSHDDRIAPATVAAILRLAAEGRPELRPIVDGLAVGAFDGTLAPRYRVGDTAGAGVVRAKTGTLTGVSSLGGTVITAHGRLLVFVLIADATRSRAGAESALDATASALARL